MASRRWLAGMVVVGALALTGCGSEGSEAGQEVIAPPEGSAFTRFGSGDLEVESFDSYEAMAAASDAVVVAEVVAFGPGRTIQGDAAEDRVTYSHMTINVTRPVVGSSTGTSYQLELLGGASDPTLGDALLAEGEFLIFLHEKGGVESGLYRPVVYAGVIVEGPDGLKAPMADPASNAPLLAELAQYLGLDAFADALAHGG